MWLTPAASASRRTARAASGSRGGPNTPGPVSCIAPYPIRFTTAEVPGKLNRPPSFDPAVFECLTWLLKSFTAWRKGFASSGSSQSGARSANAHWQLTTGNLWIRPKQFLPRIIHRRGSLVGLYLRIEGDQRLAG